MAGDKEDASSDQRASPEEAIYLVLTYLPLLELLTMTQVCKSLRDAIDNDVLPWLDVAVCPPLSARLSDDTLMEVVSRAKGRLNVLSLVNCVRITDDGLLKIVAGNSGISKLHVPSCTGLSPAGTIRAVKLLTETSNNLKSLRIDGIYGISKEDFRALQHLIRPNHAFQPKQVKIFYHKYNRLSVLEREEACPPVDVDVCPKCDQVRMVFDCPLADFRNTRHGGHECRGCVACIPRCKECGICFSDDQELEDAACVDALCLDCWLRLPKCNFCNKPYCNEHASSQHRITGSPGFVCDYCHSKFDL